MLYSKLHQQLLNLLKLNCTVENHTKMMSLLDYTRDYYVTEAGTIDANRANQILTEFNIEIQTSDCEIF